MSDHGFTDEQLEWADQVYEERRLRQLEDQEAGLCPACRVRPHVEWCKYEGLHLCRECASIWDEFKGK